MTGVILTCQDMSDAHTNHTTAYVELHQFHQRAKKNPTKNLIYNSAKGTEVEDKKSKERHRRKPTANSCYAIDMQLYIEKKKTNDK